MCPLFGKKSKDEQSSVIGNAWSVVKGKYDGKDIIIRFNAYYDKFKNRDDYKYQVGIATPLIAPEANGLPSSGENAELQDIEEMICSSLEENNKALFVAAISTNSMKEFVFYTLDPECIKQRFESLQEKTNSHKIQLMIKLDRDWSVYKTLKT